MFLKNKIKKEYFLIFVSLILNLTFFNHPLLAAPYQNDFGDWDGISSYSEGYYIDHFENHLGISSESNTKIGNSLTEIRNYSGITTPVFEENFEITDQDIIWSDNFDDGSLNGGSGWKTGGNRNWSVRWDSNSYNYTYSARSGQTTSAGQTSWIERSFTPGNTITFYWSLRGASSTDCLQLFDGGQKQFEICGLNVWEKRSYTVKNGTIRWNLYNDSASSPSSWVDDV